MMTLSEIERVLSKATVDRLLGGDDPLAAVVSEINNTNPNKRRAYQALVALYAIVYGRVTSRKYDGA